MPESDELSELDDSIGMTTETMAELFGVLFRPITEVDADHD